MRAEAHGADRGCTSVWPEGHSPKPPPAEGEGLGNHEVWLPALSRSSEKPLKRPRVREGQTRFQHKDVMVPST